MTRETGSGAVVYRLRALSGFPAADFAACMLLLKIGK